MNKIIPFFMLLFSINVWSSNITRTYKISYCQDDFSFSYDANGQLEISASETHFFSEKDEPGLPMLPYEISFDGQYSYISSKVLYKQRLIKSNVEVRRNPIPVITGDESRSTISNTVVNFDGVFPENNFIFSTQSRWSDYTVLYFLVCPFIYDATTKNLYFIESFTVDVSVSQDEVDSSKQKLGKVSSQMREILNKDVQYTTNHINSSEQINSFITSTNSETDSDIEYVIITADSLKKAFEPLNNWKRIKGLKTKIISVEDIVSKYPGTRNSLKIKNCIHDLYLNHGLTYVLLGGDDTIIPTQGCYGQVYKDTTSYYIDKTIPADIFYACFDGDFEWDGNGNGIYGELTDNINFTQYIYVTRVPIKTSTDVSSFVNKLLRYETNPNWSNRILMCGTKLWGYMKNSTQSDAEAKGENLYTNFIKPFWNGERYRFYDTITDFSSNDSYDLTTVNLTNQISRGYDFIDIMTHGSQTTWSMEKGSSYSSYYGLNQTNIRSSIITTMACHTNAFDASDYPGRSDPCLSESLIRNPSSGVVAYLGSSRYGWGYGADKDNNGDNRLGPSLQYEAEYFKHLFSYKAINRNYGAIVAAAKNSMISKCSSYDAYRWLQMSLNPIGDPEMPIYIERPRVFNDIEFEQNTKYIKLNTNVKGCRICVTSAQDNGDVYHKRYDVWDNIILDQFPRSYTLCITKQGYIPAIYHFSYDSSNNKWLIQNETLRGKNCYNLGTIEVGQEITNNLPAGNVDVNSGTTEIIGKSVTLRPGFTVKRGAELIIKSKN